MKKSAIILSIFGLLLSGMVGTAMAKGGRFAACDKDGKGYLTQEEFLGCFKKGTPEKFTAMDADKDGKLTKEEIKAYHAAKKGAKKKAHKTTEQ